MKDTKLISNNCRLHTIGDQTNISAKRIRTDDCDIKTVKGYINIASYIETGKGCIET